MMLAWTTLQPAKAQAPSDCQSMADGNARLDCYDKIFPPTNRQPGGASSNPTPRQTAVVEGQKTSLDYSWANVVGCKTITKAPAFKFSNLPADARSVSLVLTQGDREFGGQEVTLPGTGFIPEGTIYMRGPCIPGNYRWTATIKAATGNILATVSADRWFPAN